MAAKIQVKVELPKKLIEELDILLTDKGLTLDEVVRLYLRSLVTSNEKSKALELKSELPFGKFKGEELEVIIRAEPKYISWLLSNGKGLKLSPAALALLETMVGKEA